MASYSEALTPLIRTILQSSDLSTISAKGVRKNLISRGQDEATIKANRAAIDEVISTLYDELTAQAGTSRSPSPPVESKPRVHNPTSTPSGSQSQHPPSSVPRPLSKPKVKQEPVQSKAEISSDEEEGEVDDDAAYARQLQNEFNSYGARPSRATARPKPKTKKKAVKRKAKSDATVDGASGDEEPKKKRATPNTAFNKDMILSDALSTLVGESRLSRPQTVKRIWDYVKERGLQDPEDKRYIVTDGPLKDVFHTDRLHMFTMNKILSKHFMDPADVVVKKDEPEIL